MFVFSNIIFPLFFAWPRAKQLEKEGKLVKPIPVIDFLFPAIVNTVLIIGSIWIVATYIERGLIVYCGVLILSFFAVVRVIRERPPSFEGNLEADFEDRWKEYLR